MGTDNRVLSQKGKILFNQVMKDIHSEYTYVNVKNIYR